MRDEAELLKLGHAARRDRRLEPDGRFFALRKFRQRQLGQFTGQLLIALAVAGNAHAVEHLVELVLVLDAIVRRFATAPLEQRMSQVLGVRRVRRRAARDAACQSARHKRVGGRAADAGLGAGHAKGVNPAWALQAVTAAQAGLAKAALRQLRFVAIPRRGNAGGLRRLEHQNRIGTDRAFHCYSSCAFTSVASRT